MLQSQKAEEVAVKRVQMLSPLLTESLDPAKLTQMKEEICQRYQISARTLRRYLAEYRKNGFTGLKPKQSGRAGKRSVPNEVLEEAIRLRREVPKRSVSTLIQILEWEGKIAPGSVSRSTLQDHLSKSGYSNAQMRIYRQEPTAARRFQHANRNNLWQSDIKYGPYLQGKPSYLVAFLDDCTRFVLHAEFYETLDQQIVEHAFRQSLQKYGQPKAVYFDNGKQYRTKVMERACAKLEIRLLYTRPYSAESKGKIERFNRTLDSFLAEIATAKPKDLKSLNQLLDVWLAECYQNRPHRGLEAKKSPALAFQQDSEPLRFIASESLAEAFLRVEQRKVDKAGCISFNGKKYELEYGLLLVGRKATLLYDSAAPDLLWVEADGLPRFTAKPLQIGSRSASRPVLPRGEVDHPAQSRYLAAAKLKNQIREKQQKNAISFRDLGEDRHV